MTPHDSLTGIEVVGEPIAYADGFESELLGLLERASDRSTDSPELAAQIRDWPSLYHLSRARANILMPLEVKPGMRVLECGAGTGILTRWLVDQGAEVVALEGALTRAQCAATRVVGGGPGTARVVCADLGQLAAVDGLGDFDLVLIIGVLEYFGRYGLDPQSFLGHCRDILRPGGKLALAIENQIGLKYLLGGQEEHIGLPWAGVEGYNDPAGIRTYSRREIAHMFAAAGFKATEFLSVFPDYKLPSAILRDRLISSDAGAQLLTNLVREPVSYRDNAPERLCDARLAMRVFARAGLGAETSSSILCIGFRDAPAPQSPSASSCEGWLFSSCARRPDFQEARALRLQSQEMEIPTLDLCAIDAARGPVRVGWLVRHSRSSAPLVSGECAEDRVLDAIARHDLASAADVLRQWFDFLCVRCVTSTVAESPNPFCRSGVVETLAPELLDVSLANFICDGEEALHFVDAEWHATGGVERDLVALRALLDLGVKLVHGGLEHPWSPLSRPLDVALNLADLVGIADAQSKIETVLDGEKSLQGLVVEGPWFQERAQEVITVSTTHRSPHDLNWLRMRRDVQRMQDTLQRMQDTHVAERDERARMTASHDALERELAVLDDLAQRQELEIEAWRARWDRLERIWIVRFVRHLRSILRR